jgi:hypothetical protein
LDDGAKMVSLLLKENKRKYEKTGHVLFGNGCIKIMG